MYHYTTVSAYNKTINELEKDYENKITQAQLKEILGRIYEVSTHPKFELLFEIAWSKGHSQGFVEVLNEFDDMVPLIR